MKKLTLAFAIIIAVVVLNHYPEKSSVQKISQPPSIYTLIENGGTVPEEEQEEALQTVYSLLQQLISLERRKSTKNTQINIILTSQPNRIAWSGSPKKLREEAELVKKLVAFKPTFSDLVMAFKQIETTINLSNSSKISLYWIGPVIHVPFQRTDDEVKVTVPQPVPKELALPYFSEKLSVLKIYGVHPDQDEIVLEYMRSIGVIQRNKDSLDFTLLGAAQTRGRINDLL